MAIVKEIEVKIDKKLMEELRKCRGEANRLRTELYEKTQKILDMEARIARLTSAR